VATSNNTSSPCTYTTTTTTHPPQVPGLYALNFVVKTGDTVVGVFNVTTDVTCSATITDWCTQGERRWIENLEGGPRCMRTYLPCGLETAVGVPNTNPCTKYPCYSNFTCGVAPIGGNSCAQCTPNTAGCVASCTNADNSTRVCGDDGCGNICPNVYGTTNGCPTTGNSQCDLVTGQCVVPR
jgi:hypothetical protein